MGSRVDAFILHEDGEDDFIELRPSRSFRACALADDMVSNAANWSPKAKRLLDAKLRRRGARRPEFLNGIADKSKLQITERIAHLARTRACT